MRTILEAEVIVALFSMSLLSKSQIQLFTDEAKLSGMSLTFILEFLQAFYHNASVFLCISPYFVSPLFTESEESEEMPRIESVF
jgi:hypothetical protein